MENFYKKIYNCVKLIPFGRVATYGEIARACGNEKASRVVGFALLKNSDQDSIPGYRVVNKDGSLSKRFAYGGISAQKYMLMKEGISVKNNKVDLKRYGFYFW